MQFTTHRTHDQSLFTTPSLEVDIEIIEIIEIIEVTRPLSFILLPQGVHYANYSLGLSIETQPSNQPDRLPKPRVRSTINMLMNSFSCLFFFIMMWVSGSRVWAVRGT